MGEIFRGWRRKLGVVTLCTAAMLAIGWLRSLQYTDEFWICPTLTSSEIFVSAHGEIVWLRSNGTVYAMPTLFYWDSTYHLGATPPFRSWAESTVSRYVLPGFECSHRIHPVPGDEWSETEFVVCYWLITIPLTFVAAWLIVSGKPASPKSTTVPEPQPEGSDVS